MKAPSGTTVTVQLNHAADLKVGDRTPMECDGERFMATIQKIDGLRVTFGDIDLSPTLPSVLPLSPAEQIERQFGQSEILCPYCGKKNADSGRTVRGITEGEPLCCNKFAQTFLVIITQTSGDHALYPERVEQATEMISWVRVAEVEKQIREAQIGMRSELICPYCSSSMEMGEMKFCCREMSLATAAVLDRIEMQERADNAARVADKI